MSHGGNVWQGERPDIWQDHSANLRPEGMPDWVRGALLRGMEAAVYYPDPASVRASRALAAHLGTDADCVLPTAGGISALDLVTGMGAERLLLADPCFTEYAALAARHGLPVQRVNILRGTQITLEPLMAAVRPGDMVRLCNPINPIGAAFPREEVLRLLKVCERAGALLTVDEAFIDFCGGESVCDAVREHDRLIVCGSLTKLLAVPGVRVGYVCAAAAHIRALKAQRLTWEVSSFAEAVLCALPEHGDALRADTRENARRREALRGGLTALGFTVYPSQANFLLADTHADAAHIARALHEKHILVRECTDFGGGIDDGHHLRLAVRTENENLRLLEALGEAIRCAENR